MIKRSYFMSVEKPHDDGRNSYTFNNAFFTYTSFLPNHKKAYDILVACFKKKMEDIPGKEIKVVCFSKL